jgi:hypothetical protein
VRPTVARFEVIGRDSTALRRFYADLIERDPHPELGRVLQAMLSRRGQKLLGESQRRIAEIEARMVRDLSPAEQRQLAKLLERCPRAVRPGRPAASLHNEQHRLARL